MAEALPPLPERLSLLAQPPSPPLPAAVGDADAREAHLRGRRRRQCAGAELQGRAKTPSAASSLPAYVVVAALPPWGARTLVRPTSAGGAGGCARPSSFSVVPPMAGR